MRNGFEHVKELFEMELFCEHLQSSWVQTDRSKGSRKVHGHIIRRWDRLGKTGKKRLGYFCLLQYSERGWFVMDKGRHGVDS